MVIYKTHKGNGGLGDRIVGLVSCIYLSKVLKDDISIDWRTPDIKNFFEYNFINSKESFAFMDDYKKVEFIKSDSLEGLKGKSIQTNLNFIDNIFINQGIDKSEYLSEVLDIYSKLFVDYLKPKENLQNYINSNLGKFKGKTIGVQIRMGDIYMNVDGEQKNFEIKKIEKSLKSLPDNFDSVFLTTDNNQVVDLFFRIFKNKNIIYDKTGISHIDKMNANEDQMLKVLSDIITLSKTDFRYITIASNFGRIANLISEKPHNFKSIGTLKDVELIKLTKKGKIF